MAAELAQINGVLIPQTFALALNEGMSIPLMLHFEKNSSAKTAQRIGNDYQTDRSLTKCSFR